MGKIPFPGVQRLESRTSPKKPAEALPGVLVRLDDAAPPGRARLHGLRRAVLHVGLPGHKYHRTGTTLLYRQDWKTAIDTLHSTIIFPEFTAGSARRPARSLRAGINEDPAIKSIEHAIIDKAWEEVWCRRSRGGTDRRRGGGGLRARGPRVCAQQLARAGHDVTVFDKSDRIGGGCCATAYRISSWKRA